MHYIKRWHDISANTPSYNSGYKWFDVKTMTHYKTLPVLAIFQWFTKYSFIRHG